MMYHSPAPWKATPSRDRGAGYNWTIRAEHDICVAETGRVPYSYTLAESKANAYLIAAAPDLLAALIKLEIGMRGEDMIYHAEVARAAIAITKSDTP